MVIEVFVLIISPFAIFVATMAHDGDGKTQQGSSSGPVTGSDGQTPTGPFSGQAGNDPPPPSPPLSGTGTPSGGGTDGGPLDHLSFHNMHHEL